MEERIILNNDRDSARNSEKYVNNKSEKENPRSHLTSEDDNDGNKTESKTKRGFRLRKDFLMKFIILALALGGQFK